MMIDLNKKLIGKPNEEVITHFLGFTARLISGSKTSYQDTHPTHKIFFNACVFDKNFKQIWHGDIDFFNEKETLQEFADFIGETIYVTCEQPYRWDGLDKNQIKDNDDVIIFKNK